MPDRVKTSQKPPKRDDEWAFNGQRGAFGMSAYDVRAMSVRCLYDVRATSVRCPVVCPWYDVRAMARYINYKFIATHPQIAILWSVIGHNPYVHVWTEVHAQVTRLTLTIFLC